jgi:hypothetical protein
MKFKIIILLFIIVTDNNLFSQISEFRKIMYVTSKEGLRQREEPSVNSKSIGIFLFGERIIVYEKGPKATIDGITNYWYKSHTAHSSTNKLHSWCWIFGGYLSDELPLDALVFLGRWDDINDNRWLYEFDPNGGYMKGIKNSDRLERGEWVLNGNMIIITFSVDDNEIVKLTEIDRNNIILHFPNNIQVVLRRTNDLN